MRMLPVRSFLIQIIIIFISQIPNCHNDKLPAESSFEVLKLDSKLEDVAGGAVHPTKSLNVIGQDGDDLLLLQADASDINQLSGSSHKIEAVGWPSTSPMWPSIDKTTTVGVNEEASNKQTVEPFIYADKPRTVDYSLLLKINDTILNILKSRVKPMSLRLSFDYYFNYDTKLSALPAIKIEIDRKQYKHLEPSASTSDPAANTQNKVKPKVWINFDEPILITDPQQFANHDWLKFSLVVRQAPSLVAIRHLKVEFLMSGEQQQSSNPRLQQATSNIQQPDSLAPTQASKVVPQQTNPPPAPPTQFDSRLQPGTSPIQYQQPGQALEQVPAASEIIQTTIKPVEPKRKGWGERIWGSGRKRRRRQVNEPAVDQKISNQTNILLTCFRADECDWIADGHLNEPIQWSLARMPPSTNQVQSGYYYVSNRDNYGDASKLLRISLNQTDSATIADQNSDHCIDLAIYVTERTLLKLYRLQRYLDDNLQEQFSKANLLLTWAPTMTNEFVDLNLSQWRRRRSLPGSRILAQESQQNGWTMETICYGDFFANPKECGSGNCYFGYEMETAIINKPSIGKTNEQGFLDTNKDLETKPKQLSLLEDKTIPEQIVGLAILKQFTTNIPIKQKPKWLESWQRDEVEPSDSWKFYPNLDIQNNGNNVSFINLFDNAHYYIESDWLNVDYNLDLTGVLSIELLNFNETLTNSSSYTSLIEQIQAQQGTTLYQQQGVQSAEDANLFQLKINTRLVDSNFDLIYSNNSTIDWPLKNTQNVTNYNLGLPISERILAARNNELKRPSGNADQAEQQNASLFKVILEFMLTLNDLLLTSPVSSTREDDRLLAASSASIEQFFANNSISYRMSLVNVSVSDRCFPNPCQYGSCQQNGTGYEDWNCQCDDKHRGRRCDFARWCNLAHVTPWQPPVASSSKDSSNLVTLKTAQQPQQQQQLRQLRVVSESITRITGREFCQRKLGNGFKCTDIDLPLNENLYTDEGKTFLCSCQDDYYLSDDAKCKQAHLCNSVVCPSIGQICDESKPFNRSQPCQCNEKQDWFPNPQLSSLTQASSALDIAHNSKLERCVRNQCREIKRDCGFEAHICLPTLAGEKPICKCGPKFTLKTNDKGQKFCDSTACVLPTLNDCDQICLKDNNNQEHPYTCACHPGYELKPDKKACAPAGNKRITCKPGCHTETQICTDAGCKCKQGYVGESEVIVQRNQPQKGSSNNVTIDYVQSVKCLNVCALTYAENKHEFEMVESVCPLGLCNPTNFQCRCSDPSSSALINTKYEPIYANTTTEGVGSDSSTGEERKRISPLCHLRRVCEPNSSSYRICRSQGAICVPDYTKAAMFDCICPPSTEKRFYGQASSSEFSCEPKCSAKKYDCLRKQAVCKLIDKDQVRCDCLPGLMFDQHDQKCYLAKYSYAFNLIIVNRYYEPESKFHKLLNSTGSDHLEDNNGIKLYELSTIGDRDGRDTAGNNNNKDSSTDSKDQDARPLSELVPQYQQAPIAMTLKSIFIKDYNQCNITQVIPKSVIEDPYEHDIESYLSYIDQCNEKIHQNMRTYHLNSKLSEDLRQSLRQHLRDFTVTTNNSSCIETDASGMYINCTIYLQSNEPIPRSTVEYVFNDCDKNAYQSDKYCWIKPRLLLKKQDNQVSLQNNPNRTSSTNSMASNFNQVLPCEIDKFCGLDAISTRIDDKTSLCSCKCPSDIEVIDVKELESGSKQHLATNEEDPSRYAIKEICAPRNHCGANSTFCLGKVGSVCQYDIRLGSKCTCVYPSYEDSFGKCIEVTFSQLDNTLIIIIILLGTGLIVSLAINLTALARSKSLFGHSKQYPLNEFPTTTTHSSRHPNNRSTGVPNPVFIND